ncbi:hypothetical protein CERSUDRAFT_118600 [Gelatoporia subvermispora B]|uniref:F-box domain-containing protein n=1 Tax=Ceriporiopsis subvermispora (strain B) TaxID=914234 RepID=M2PAK7_CERS8|nr:hypothetical protein CERSUDRAFT_118600 [Gelatoporia subvermispora B]
MTSSASVMDVLPRVRMVELPEETLLHILSYLDLPDLTSLAQALPGLCRLTEDPILHRSRILVVAPSRVSHSLFGTSPSGIPFRPTVPELVHRGILRGLGIERRWRAGTYFHSHVMVSQYETSLRLQRTHTGNVIESSLRRRMSSGLPTVLRLLPNEANSVSPSLISTMRRLKWSIQRDTLARVIKDRSELVRNGGGIIAWLEGRGRAVMRRENERVRLAVCPGVKGTIKFYENLGRGR